MVEVGGGLSELRWVRNDAQVESVRDAEHKGLGSLFFVLLFERGELASLELINFNLPFLIYMNPPISTLDDPSLVLQDAALLTCAFPEN